MASRIVAAEGLEPGVPRNMATSLHKALDLAQEKRRATIDDLALLAVGNRSGFDALEWGNDLNGEIKDLELRLSKKVVVVPWGNTYGGVPDAVAVVKTGWFGSTSPYLGARVVATYNT